MWGQRQTRQYIYKIHGITPALAGTTLTVLADNLCSWDHPRACGDNPVRIKQAERREGSPPRLRGQLGRQCLKRKPPGITPALAGTTLWILSAVISERDHPRACGDNYCLISQLETPAGSPPRLRGQLLIPNNRFFEFGITPALAGTTLGD